MKLNVHYAPEGKTWSQGKVSRVSANCGSINFSSERKFLIYGCNPKIAKQTLDTLRKSEFSEVTLTVNNGVGGFIWGITDIAIVGTDESTCSFELDEEFQSEIHQFYADLPTEGNRAEDAALIRTLFEQGTPFENSESI